MAKWQSRIDLADLWTRRYSDPSFTVAQLSAEVGKRVAASRNFVGLDRVLIAERDEIADDFLALSRSATADVEEFDEILERLYDWADTKLDDAWPPKKVAWIATF